MAAESHCFVPFLASRCRLKLLALISVVILISLWYANDIGEGNFIATLRRNFTNRKERNVTIVTALFDIGDFQKGTEFRNKTVYVRWMDVWKNIKNGVIFYTNVPNYESNFKKLRSVHQYPTRTVLVDLENGTDLLNSFSLWSLNLLPNITNIFQRPGYPKHPPNTVLPMYSVIMSGKYDLLENTIQTNPFDSDYFAWLDIGVYREYPADGPCFRVGLPPGFDEAKMAMSRVTDFRPKQTSSKIIAENQVWVGGAAAFGRGDTLLKYIDQHRSVTMRMLGTGWYSTDQQTVYSMFSDRSLGVKLPVEIQCYDQQGFGVTNFSNDEWFYLAYLARKNEPCNE